jgi:hypothetical protein
MTSASGALCLTRKTPAHLAMCFKEVTEVARHRSEIGSDKNPILVRGEGQHFGVGNSLQPGLIG